MRFHASLLLVSLAAACTADSEVNASPEAEETPSMSAPPAHDPVETSMPKTSSKGLYALATQTLEGEAADLSQYAGKVTLVVNVASKCGYTPQYAGLQELHAELADQGFAVLAFPPEINMQYGDISLNAYDLPVPLGPSSMKL